VRLLSSVEDFDEHTVHVVSLDSVPEERDKDNIIAEDVGDATAKTRAGELLSDVEYNEENDERDAEVQQNTSHSTTTSFTAVHTSTIEIVVTEKANTVNYTRCDWGWGGSYRL